MSNIKTLLTKEKGFTLIELLVVIAIIGLLSSVVLASLNTARMKARDAQRISGLKEIQKALEMYYQDYGTYPGPPNQYYYSKTGSETDGCGPADGWVQHGGIGTWCLLDTALIPYISKLPRDPLGNQTTNIYTYKYIYGSKLGPDMYGLSTILENSNSISQNDGGAYSTYFEIGGLPSYCRTKYIGTDGNWNVWNQSLACVGGN